MKRRCLLCCWPFALRYIAMAGALLFWPFLQWMSLTPALEVRGSHFLCTAAVSRNCTCHRPKGQGQQARCSDAARWPSNQALGGSSIA
jgi:hypothetical protein